jgi:hypothetical protein
MNREELLKNAKPILFNTEMVQAILEGRKTVTRRVIKPQPIAGIRKSVFVPSGIEDGHGREIKLLYKVGDILYVRETFNNTETDTVLYAADKDFIDFGCKEVDRYLFMESEIKWKPSIHMPKEAARIFLKVTDVRVERLQDITEEQAIKEGFEQFACTNCRGSGCSDCSGSGLEEPGMVGFIYTWDNIYEKRGYGWEANPWVWVIEFERVEAENED